MGMYSARCPSGKAEEEPLKRLRRVARFFRSTRLKPDDNDFVIAIPSRFPPEPATCSSQNRSKLKLEL